LSERLYRHFDEAGELLYVGVTSRLPRRVREHQQHSPWWEKIARIEVKPYPDRQSVLEAERVAIENEKPKFNKRHNLPKRQVKEPEATASISGQNITGRLIQLRPVYTINEAAEATGVSRSVIAREIATGRLGSFNLPRARAEGEITYVSGWQIVDWLECLGAKP